VLSKVPVPHEDKFGKLAKVKSIIRDMLHKVQIHEEEEKILFRNVRGH
jgi:hypothetical protein